MAEHVQEFAIDLVMSTQPGTAYAHELANKYIRYGSSPRGAQALVECGRVLALMRGRLNLSIDDVREIAPADRVKVRTRNQKSKGMAADVDARRALSHSRYSAPC